jgi:sec-independent protein translocase protein TatA
MGLDNPLHIAFLLIVLLLVFGARRLPEIGRSLGGGMREFKDSISGASSQPSITQQQAPPMQAPVQPVAQQQAVPVPGQPVAQPAPVQPVQVAPQPVQAPVQPAPPVQQQPEQAPAAPAQPAEHSQQA